MTNYRTGTQFNYLGHKDVKQVGEITDVILEAAAEFGVGTPMGSGIMLHNGGMLSVDSGLLQYYTPRCSVDKIAAYEAAGHFLAQEILNATEKYPDVKLAARVTDNRGHHMGYFEEYNLESIVQEPNSLMKSMVPFLVSRQMLTAPGWVVPEQYKSNLGDFCMSGHTMFVKPDGYSFKVGQLDAINVNGNTVRINIGEPSARLADTRFKLEITMLALQLVNSGFRPPEPLFPKNPAQAFIDVSKSGNRKNGRPFNDLYNGQTHPLEVLESYRSMAYAELYTLETEQTMRRWQQLINQFNDNFAFPDTDRVVKYRTLISSLGSVADPTRDIGTWEKADIAFHICDSDRVISFSEEELAKIERAIRKSPEENW